MAIQIILDNEFATLVYHEEEGIIHHTFHKPIGGENFREVLSKGIETLKLHRATKWLSDDRNNSTISDEDTDWAINTWSTGAIAAGWKYWALVVPHDLMARFDYREHVDSYFKRGVRVMVFTDLTAAKEWLEKHGK